MIDKIQNFILTPIKVSYKERSDYSPIENFILNPLVLALLVFLVTFQAFSLSGEAKPTQSDTALSNAMIYFEKGDFDNAVLQLESVVDNYSGSKAAHQAKFYLGRTAFINGNNDKALVYLSESVSKLKFDNLKKEGYIMLAELQNDIKMYDKAMKYTSSENEIKYISILKAKKLADNNQLDQATLLLESLDTDNPLYNELYEEVYGYVLSIS
jgi:predicted negative regulator of RcsB-dependent stress response|tara:strand:+ start:1434 stop:2069 length:636 start_codon:yes stop_codon:yes gene_type:complete